MIDLKTIDRLNKVHRAMIKSLDSREKRIKAIRKFERELKKALKR